MLEYIVRICVGLMFWLGILPFILAPFLPERFKGKEVIELNCTVQKAFDMLTMDPRKCPMTGEENKGLEASKEDADKDGKLLKWREQTNFGKMYEVYSIEQTFQIKSGKEKTARVVRTSKHETKPIESEWVYEIVPAGAGRCRVTLEGFTDVKDGSWQVPMFRMMKVMSGPKNDMKSHLKMLADCTGGNSKLISIS